jgi:Protein of unknown function (DUF1285)
MREYRYVVDRDGRIFHDGTEIVDAPTLRFFLRAMQRLSDGRHLAVCQGERNWFDVRDTPFVIQRVRCDEDQGRVIAVDLFFAGGYQEILDAGSLEAEDGYLYCRVRDGTFRARFGRGAIQQLAPYLLEEESGLSLEIAGTKHSIPEVVSAGASNSAR